jgi:hypothetical protein
VHFELPKIDFDDSAINDFVNSSMSELYDFWETQLRNFIRSNKTHRLNVYAIRDASNGLSFTYDLFKPSGWVCPLPG